MRLHSLCAPALAVALALGLSASAPAANLGTANAFNGFVFGNLTSHGQDTEGRLAVGGNFTASSYGVGSGGVGPAVPLTNPRTDVLVVGGDMNAQGGWQVFNGNAVWGTHRRADYGQRHHLSGQSCRLCRRAGRPARQERGLGRTADQRLRRLRRLLDPHAHRDQCGPQRL
jgi:hypothetical protein